MFNTPIILADIQAAAERIRPYIHRTPVVTCQSLDQRAGARLFLKCENLQKAGAFKFRGATNAILSLSEDERRRGVVAHSSGNHAQALAKAAGERGIRAYIVMPRNAPAVKQAAVAGYGGIITLCEPTLTAREQAQEQIVAEVGAAIVHPYNDWRVMAGQGTAALELLEDAPDLDAIIAPVSGGGLLSGLATAGHGINPRLRVFGAEPETADDARRSLEAGKILTNDAARSMADGLLANLGELTFPVLKEHVERIFTASEDEIAAAMRYVWERAKLIIEPSSAVPIAAIFKQPEFFAGMRVGVIVSGGNVDLDHLPWMK